MSAKREGACSYTRVGSEMTQSLAPGQDMHAQAPLGWEGALPRASCSSLAVCALLEARAYATGHRGEGRWRLAGSYISTSEIEKEKW